MKNTICALVFVLTACGGKHLADVSVSGEVVQTYCLTGDCEKTTTTIEDNKVGSTKTEPCDENNAVVSPAASQTIATSEPIATPIPESTPAAVASPVPTPVAVASPAPTPVATPVAVATPVPTPTPFVPHYTQQIHPLPQVYDHDFSMQVQVDFDINDNGVIESDNSETFVVTFFRLNDGSVVTTNQYGFQMSSFDEKYWYPGEFVNDKKPFATATQPWQQWSTVDGQRTDTWTQQNGAIYNMNAQYTFAAWAPLGNSKYRVVAYCRNQIINNSNCGVLFSSTDQNEQTGGFWGEIFTSKVIQFTDGTYNQSAVATMRPRGKHLNAQCLFSGISSPNQMVADACYGDVSH